MLKLTKENISKVSGGGHGHLENYEQNTKSRDAKDFIGNKNFTRRMKALSFSNNLGTTRTPYNSSKANTNLKYSDFIEDFE